MRSRLEPSSVVSSNPWGVSDGLLQRECGLKPGEVSRVIPSTYKHSAATADGTFLANLFWGILESNSDSSCSVTLRSTTCQGKFFDVYKDYVADCRAIVARDGNDIHVDQFLTWLEVNNPRRETLNLTEGFSVDDPPWDWVRYRLNPELPIAPLVV